MDYLDALSENPTLSLQDLKVLGDGFYNGEEDDRIIWEKVCTGCEESPEEKAEIYLGIVNTPCQTPRFIVIGAWLKMAVEVANNMLNIDEED